MQQVIQNLNLFNIVFSTLIALLMVSGTVALIGWVVEIRKRKCILLCDCNEFNKVFQPCPGEVTLTRNPPQAIPLPEL